MSDAEMIERLPNGIQLPLDEIIRQISPDLFMSRGPAADVSGLESFPAPFQPLVSDPAPEPEPVPRRCRSRPPSIPRAFERVPEPAPLVVERRRCRPNTRAVEPVLAEPAPVVEPLRRWSSRFRRRLLRRRPRRSSHRPSRSPRSRSSRSPRSSPNRRRRRRRGGLGSTSTPSRGGQHPGRGAPRRGFPPVLEAESPAALEPRHPHGRSRLERAGAEPIAATTTREWRAARPVEPTPAATLVTRPRPPRRGESSPSWRRSPRSR